MLGTWGNNNFDVNLRISYWWCTSPCLWAGDNFIVTTWTVPTFSFAHLPQMQSECRDLKTGCCWLNGWTLTRVLPTYALQSEQKSSPHQPSINKCTNGHKHYGHHPAILMRLQQLNLQCLVPYIIWHKNSFTQALTDNDELASHLQLFYSSKESFEQLVQHQPHSSKSQQILPHFDDVLVKVWKEPPTHHSIAAYFNLGKGVSIYSSNVYMTTLLTVLLW